MTRPAGGLPRSGEILRLTRAASVQFSSPMLFRVIRVHDWTTYQGWVWLDGYEVNSVGDAVERRSVFVQIAGLQRIGPAAPAPRTVARPHRPSPRGPST